MALNTPSSLPDTGYLRLNQVLQLFPVSRSTWWRGIKEGRYPQPIKLSPGTTAWKVEDIRQLLDDLGESTME